MVEANKPKLGVAKKKGVTKSKKTTTVTKPKPRVTPGAAAASATRGAAATGKRVVGSTRDDYECPVCLELCAQPVVTPCKHFMCFQCHKRVVEAGMTCPMCRAHFDKLFIPQIDRELQDEIAAAMGN